MKKTRIVLVVTDFPKLSETFIVSKFLGLLEKGWDIHVVCRHSKKDDWAQFAELTSRRALRKRVHPSWSVRPRGLALVLLPFALLRGLVRSPASSLRYLLQGWKLFRADTLRRFYLDAELICLQPDVIHFEFGALAPARMYLKELLNCKVAVSFRGYDLNFVGLEEPKHYDPVWQHADALHLLGDDLWARAVRRGCPPEKIHALIPPGIDLAYFNAPPRSHEEVVPTPERPLRILSVGRLEWKKGYEYAIQGVRQLFDQRIALEYRIIGDGNYYEPLSFLRHQMGLDSFVELCGAQPREVVKEQMQWADVFLHAAVSEGFCNAVIEAQAMGLPVVTSDADGLAENVQDKISGFVVCRRNATELARKVQLLAGDPVLRRNMGLEGRNRALKQFNLERLIRDFTILYQRLLDQDDNGKTQENT